MTPKPLLVAEKTPSATPGEVCPKAASFVCFERGAWVNPSQEFLHFVARNRIIYRSPMPYSPCSE